MRKNSLLSLLQDTFSFKKTTIVQDSMSGNNSISNSNIANTINKTINNNFEIKVETKQQVKEIFESSINPSSSIEIREAILPIEDLINQGKFSLAITRYNELISSPSFVSYTKNDRFSVLIGMLNCHINNNSTEEVIDYWSNKIKAIGEGINEIHRFYYLMGIRELGNCNYEPALAYMRQSLNSNPNYVNAITGELHLQVTLGHLTYEESVKKFNVLLDKTLSVKELSNVHANFGDVAYKAKDFKTAKEHYAKSNVYLKGLSKQIGIAICQYNLSFEEMAEDGRVELDKIDFSLMNEAEVMFNKIYEERNQDTIETIINLSFPFYLSVLALNGKHKEILSLYNDNIQYSHLLSDESINFIVEAQILNDIKDEFLISKLEEYHQIKYEAFYLEKRKEYEKVVELLTPIFESKYKEEKIFRLTFLVALKELNQFEIFMEYYQRFSAHKDEVMRMCYIEFLMKRGEVKEAIEEAKDLSKVARNGFVIYDLMFIYIGNNMNDELNEFFDNVNSGRYHIIGIHKSTVFFQMMIHIANNKDYEKFFRLYETTDLLLLEEKHRKILKINYHLFKNDFDELASSYYEYFEFSRNYNDLLKAVQSQLQVNGYHKAEFYLDLVQPMELENPEYYYMFHAMILREKNQLNKAFEELDFVVENIELDLESPFHQFFTTFNMDNNRTEIAFKYMGEYYSKNPNPKWFKVIQHSEDDTGEEILAKLEEAIGGRRDLSIINKYYNDGLIGVSVYNKIVGNGIEDILVMSHYPFTKKPISKGDIQGAKERAGFVGDKIIVDATTLIILSSVNSIDLLNVFEEIIIPTSTVIHLNEIKSRVFSSNAKKVIEFISKSPKVKKLPVDEAMRIKEKRDEVFHHDTYDCITLSRTLNTLFLNTEILVSHQYNIKEVIDINVLFLFIKENYSEFRKQVSITIAKMREVGYDFISFDSEDIFILFMEKGIEGINSFLKMGKNADYKTFSTAYTMFLKTVLDTCSPEDFKNCSIKVIEFMDSYLGKTRHYTASLIRQFPNLAERFDDLVIKPSSTNIMATKVVIEALSFNKEARQVLRTYEFFKLMEIASCFMVFGIQFISIAGDSSSLKSQCIELLRANVKFNDALEIEEILKYMSQMIKEKKRHS